MAVNRKTAAQSPTRDRALVIFAVVLLVVAAIVVWRFVAAQEPHEVGRLNLPPGSSEKAQWLKQQKTGGATGAGPSTMDTPVAK